MKGSDILKRFEKAKAVVAKRHHELGESGDYLRSNGYDIESDGFNVCHFSERDIKISYIADNCCGRPWGICERIYVGANKMSVEEIDPQKDYEVPPNPSRMEMLEKGLIKPKAFRVYEIGWRMADRKMGEFDTFEKADQFAMQLCKKEIDRLREDRDWRPHTPCSVMDYELLAKERGELRHYRSYCYEGHEYWYAVKDVEED